MNKAREQEGETGVGAEPGSSSRGQTGQRLSERSLGKVCVGVKRGQVRLPLAASLHRTVGGSIHVFFVAPADLEPAVEKY